MLKLVLEDIRHGVMKEITFLVNLVSLSGANKHHLELGAGPRYVINGGLQGYLPFAATIGWRIQEPGGNFIFRMGVSWPEAVYIGLGFSF